MLDEITKAFEQITMADFERATSAVDEKVYADDFPQDFDEFVDSLVDGARTQAEKADEFQPLAVLCSPELRRVYIPDPDETVIDFASRLQREAQSITATWLFTSILSCGRVYDADENPPAIDPDDPVALQEALDRGEVQVAVCWYAEMRDQSNHRWRAGIIGFDENGVPTPGIEGDIDREKTPFYNVLDR